MRLHVSGHGKCERGQIAGIAPSDLLSHVLLAPLTHQLPVRPARQVKCAAGGGGDGGCVGGEWGVFPGLEIVGATDRTEFSASAVDQLTDAIRKSIRKGRLSEGDVLPPVKEIARLSGACEMVVRGAIRRLTSEGLVRSRRHVGCIVCPSAAKSSPTVRSGCWTASRPLRRSPIPSSTSTARRSRKVSAFGIIFSV